MTNKKSTKRALLLSALSLLLCVSMLVGSTFAWFTDSVTSGNNIIKSGNLDIELEYWNGTAWTDVKGASDILSNTLWEPGVTEVAYLRVANAGSLALKYQLGINILNEIEGKNQTGETFKLSDYIMFGVVENVNGENGAYAKTDAGRAEAIADVTAAKNISAGYTKASTMASGNELYLALVVYMPTTVDNVANHNGTDVPQIDLGINVYASQMASEEDSFGPDYDKDSSFFVSNADELRTAIANVKDGGTVYVNDGIYNINSQINVAGKSINIVGVGKNAVIHMTDTRVNYNKIFYIYGSATEGEDVTVNISNLILTADIATKSDIWVRTDTSSGAKVSGDVNVNLDNVTCTSIICDNNYVDGDTINLNIINSKVKKVALDASPFNNNGLNTYTNLTYENSRIDSMTINPAVNDLTHITINGEHPTAHGEQQILDYVDTVEELQAALDAATGDATIVLAADINGDVTATQKEGVNIVIDGQNYNYDGTIYLNGNSRHTGAETLAIKNIDFVTDKTLDFISCNNGQDSVIRYAHNVTIEDCTFTNKGEGTVVPARFRQCYNITMKDCTVEGTFSPLWVTGVKGLTIDNVIANCKNEGITVDPSDNVLIQNCKITVAAADKFGIRAGAQAGYKMTVNNCELNAALPITIRNAVDTYTVIVDGMKLAAPATLQKMIENAADGDTIALSSGTYAEVTLKNVAENLTIVGTKGAVVKGIHGVKSNPQLKVIGLTLKNIAFQDKGLYFDAGNPWNLVKNLTMTRCTFVGTGASDNVNGNRLFDICSDSAGSNQYFNIVIENCTVSNAIQGIRLGGLEGEDNVIRGNIIENIGHNGITLRSVNPGAKVLVEGNKISNGGDRALRIGTNSGSVTYKTNTIINCGDPDDSTNFKANTPGNLVFEGNTVNGAAWNPLV